RLRCVRCRAPSRGASAASSPAPRGRCAGAADVPYFSVITPVFRPDPEALRDTLESVRAQTFTDWEHVLVDDRSDDDAVAAVLWWAADSDPRFRVVERAANGGIVAA